LALSLIDQEHVSTRTEADLSSLPDKRFWAFMDARGWCHPYDERGQRKSFAAIPERLTDLVDDPYRGLAGELRRAGGCAKEPAPFSEFLWADFLRDKVPSELLRDDFEAAIQLAQAVAKTDEASYLPGWCGPHGSAQ